MSNFSYGEILALCVKGKEGFCGKTSFTKYGIESSSFAWTGSYALSKDFTWTKYACSPVLVNQYSLWRN